MIELKMAFFVLQMKMNFNCSGDFSGKKTNQQINGKEAENNRKEKQTTTTTITKMVRISNYMLLLI